VPTTLLTKKLQWSMVIYIKCPTLQLRLQKAVMSSSAGTDDYSGIHRISLTSTATTTAFEVNNKANTY
jgi:hypothetical protein